MANKLLYQKDEGNGGPAVLYSSKEDADKAFWNPNEKVNILKDYGWISRAKASKIAKELGANLMIG